MAELAAAVAETAGALELTGALASAGAAGSIDRCRRNNCGDLGDDRVDARHNIGGRGCERQSGRARDNEVRFRLCDRLGRCRIALILLRVARRAAGQADGAAGSLECRRVDDAIAVVGAAECRVDIEACVVRG